MSGYDAGYFSYLRYVLASEVKQADKIIGSMLIQANA
jgi:hypothetical protein